MKKQYPDDSHLSEPRRKELNARYNKMMEVLREKLDEASRKDGEYYYLTAAVTASPWVLGGMSLHDFVEYLDFVSVMSYDYHGGLSDLPPIAVDVDFDGIYDHPSYTYKIHVTNNTGSEIPGGWTVSFDLPKSAVFKSSWAGNATQEDVGEFTRVTLTAGAWNKIPVDAKGMVVELPMIKDKAGEYSYDVILRNAVGETKSNSVKVMVTEQLSKPLAGSVVATPVIEGNYDITMTILAKSQATSYTLYKTM